MPPPPLLLPPPVMPGMEMRLPSNGLPFKVSRQLSKQLHEKEQIYEREYPAEFNRKLPLTADPAG